MVISTVFRSERKNLEDNSGVSTGDSSIENSSEKSLVRSASIEKLKEDVISLMSNLEWKFKPYTQRVQRLRSRVTFLQFSDKELESLKQKIEIVSRNLESVFNIENENNEYGSIGGRISSEYLLDEICKKMMDVFENHFLCFVACELCKSKLISDLKKLERMVKWINDNLVEHREVFEGVKIDNFDIYYSFEYFCKSKGFKDYLTKDKEVYLDVFEMVKEPLPQNVHEIVRSLMNIIWVVFETITRGS